MTNTPDEIIRSFCAKWADGNVKEIVNYFDENAIYHNIPMAPVNGVDEIRLFIEGFFSSAESIDFEILHQVASGNIVMNDWRCNHAASSSWSLQSTRWQNH